MTGPGVTAPGKRGAPALSNWAPLVAEEERLLAALATLPAHSPVAVGAVF